MSNNKRDNQRQKLYNAESESLHGQGRKFKDLKEVNQYVKKICKSHCWKKQGGALYIEVHDGRGRRRAGAYSRYDITLPRWSRQEWVVLHELAHTLINFNKSYTASHGPEFAKCFLGLIKRFMGIENYNLLKAAYKKYHVHYSVKRSL